MESIKPRTVNRTLAVTIVILVIGAAAVYTVLAAITAIDTKNSVTITPGVGLGVATFTTNPTTCPALGSLSYSTVTPFTNTIAWSITAGGAQTQWFCIENQGSGNDNTPSVALTNIPTSITCTTAPCLTLTTNPVTIPALNAQTVSAPIAVTLTSSPSATGSGTVDITVS